MTTGRDNPDPPELAVDAAVDEPRTDPQPDGATATAGASQPHDEAATRAWEGLPPDTMILASAFALFATASEAPLMCVLPRDWSKPGARVFWTAEIGIGRKSTAASCVATTCKSPVYAGQRHSNDPRGKAPGPRRGRVGWARNRSQANRTGVHSVE